MIPLITGSADAVTDEDTTVAHAVSLAVVGSILFLLTLWTAKSATRRTKAAQGSCWYKWGPTFLVGLSTVLANADSARHVLQDNHIWKGNVNGVRGWVGPGVLVTSTSFQCANSGSCCPGTDPIYGGKPYHTIYDKKCPAPQNSSCPHVDIPWSLSCDAAREYAGEHPYLTKFLSNPCEEKEGPLLKGGHWGCTYKPPGGGHKNRMTVTNEEALVALTNNTYIFGVPVGKGHYRTLSNASYCKAAKISGGVCGYFTSSDTGLLAGGGCHYNMVIRCVGATGFIITFLCTYVGFACLIVGSLWNAGIMSKLHKAREQWAQLRAAEAAKPANAPYMGAKGSSSSAADDPDCKT